MRCSLTRNMTFLTFRDRDAFSESVVPFLETHEAENALFLGSLARFTTGTAVMTLAADDNEPRAAFFYSEISAILTRGVDESSAQSISQYLIEQHVDIPAVVGPAAEVKVF